MVQYVQIQKQEGEGWLSSVIVTPHINRKIIEVCLFVNIFSINVLYQENNFK